MKNKTVYIELSVDVLHHGHINLINNAKKYGKVIAGLLTDSAISSQKRLPLLVLITIFQKRRYGVMFYFLEKRMR